MDVTTALFVLGIVAITLAAMGRPLKCEFKPGGNFELGTMDKLDYQAGEQGPRRALHLEAPRALEAPRSRGRRGQGRRGKGRRERNNT